MKWMNTMIAKLVTDEFELDADEKIELKAEMDKSVKKYENSDSPIVKKINAFFHHPFGVLMAVFGYANIRKSINSINLSNDSMTMEEQFKLEMKQKMMQQMLEE